jgi:integrase
MYGSFLKVRGKWAIRFDVYEGGVRKQRQVGGFRTKPEAEKALAAIVTDKDRGQYFQAKNVSLSEFLALWMEDYVRPNLAPKTVVFYESLVRVHIQDYFRKVALSDLRPIMIEKFYNHLRKNTDLSPNTIHHIHKTLKSALNHAKRWEYIKTNPMENVIAPQQQKAVIRYWDPGIIPAALKLFEGSEIEWHVKLALATGLRLGEICALKVTDLNFREKTFRVSETAQRITGKGIIYKKPKTDDSMAPLPMTPHIEALFSERLLWKKKNRLFFGERYERSDYLAVFADGRAMEPTYVYHTFQKVLHRQKVTGGSKTTKVPVIAFHGLRHSCASYLISQGVPMKVVQMILRHSDFKVTANTYSHILIDEQREALARIF